MKRHGRWPPSQAGRQLGLLLTILFDAGRDTRFTMGPVDVLDHASRGFTYGSKMGIDGTRKWKEEGFTREWPDVITMDPETRRRVDEMWPELGITLAGASGAHRS